ncbi:MAG: pyridine nucleotide-disulfide oxidoreductase, partial [Anaerocolumna sp.]|nr:pyridine nucleotide-disulfide oxidoreductase [Anaerocolumna sp.]
LFAAGDNGKNSSLQYLKVEKNVTSSNYEKYYFINNRLSGVILIGDTAKAAELSEALEEKRSYSEMF